MRTSRHPSPERNLRRVIAGALAAGAILTGALGTGIALTAGTAQASPEEDCAAVRARDHQIYLNLINSLCRRPS